MTRVLLKKLIYMLVTVCILITASGCTDVGKDKTHDVKIKEEDYQKLRDGFRIPDRLIKQVNISVESSLDMYQYMILGLPNKYTELPKEANDYMIKSAVLFPATAPDTINGLKSQAKEFDEERKRGDSIRPEIYKGAGTVIAAQEVEHNGYNGSYITIHTSAGYYCDLICVPALKGVTKGGSIQFYGLPVAENTFTTRAMEYGYEKDGKIEKRERTINYSTIVIMISCIEQ